MASCSSGEASSRRVSVTLGSLDLGGRTESADLAGMWGFWPNQFIDPEDIGGRFPRLEAFPASWTVYRPELFAAQGCATYAVRVTGLDPSVLYSFRFPAYSCAARYFANGQELYSQGNPSESRKDERPQWAAALVPLPAPGVESVILVVHLSNFNDIFPASSVPVSVGSFENMGAKRARVRLLMIIPFGAILAMGAYFISLFVFHREEDSSLWLGLLCAVFALRILCYDEYMLLDIVPSVSPDLIFRLGYLTFSLAVAFFSLFVRAQYPLIAKNYVVYPIIGLASAYGILNLASPISFITGILIPFQVFTLLSSGYLLFVMIKAALAGTDGAVLFLGGFFVFMAIVVRDILIANRLIDGVFLAHYGILGIIAAMGLIIVRHFSLAFSTVEAGARRLEKMNLSLGRFVPNEFLTFLGKKSITEICLGDNIEKDMSVMFIHLGIELPLDGAASRLNMLELFNNTLLIVNPLIQKHGGFVDKYLSDGVMVLFSGHPSHAVFCALDVQKALEKYNHERLMQWLPRILFAAGIHRGSLMLGTIGDEERMDSTVISDVVNVSSRLQHLAVTKKLSIVISGEVASALGEGESSPWTLVPHGEAKLRGKDLSVSIFEVRRS